MEEAMLVANGDYLDDGEDLAPGERGKGSDGEERESGGTPTPADAARHEAPPIDDETPAPRLTGRKAGRGTGRALVKEDASDGRVMTARERLCMLDLWQRSGLPARDFGALVGISRHTLYAWQRRFTEYGPAGLEDGMRGGPRGSKLDEVTKRAILMMKEAHPEYGTERIAALLLRGPALAASPGAVARVLKEAGYKFAETPTRPHGQEEPKEFERARPNQLWQTDLFTFILKRQNQRVYLVAFLDDHSRYITGFGLHASQSGALVIEVVRAAMGSYGKPDEILTDNGTQYYTWRGKSAFTRELEARGVRQIVARPKHPKTLGKIERFWGTLWRELLEKEVFRDLGDARVRIGHYIDHYNFQRPHSSLGKLVPADRFFGAAEEVKKTLAARVAKNALELARDGVRPAPFYLTGQVGGKAFSVHAEGENLVLRREGGEREAIALVPPEHVPGGEAEPLPDPVCPEGRPRDLPSPEELPPGRSALDGSFDPRDDSNGGPAAEEA
jgi:transposase InsO family protein